MSVTERYYQQLLGHMFVIWNTAFKKWCIAVRVVCVIFMAVIVAAALRLLSSMIWQETLICAPKLLPISSMVNGI